MEPDVGQGGSSNLSLVFILFFKAQVEFKSSEFNHSISAFRSNEPIRANVFSEAAPAFLKSEMIAGLPSCRERANPRGISPREDCHQQPRHPCGNVVTTVTATTSLGAQGGRGFIGQSPGSPISQAALLPFKHRGTCSAPSLRNPYQPGSRCCPEIISLPLCFPRATSTSQTHLSGFHISLKDSEYGSVFQTDRLTV